MKRGIDEHDEVQQVMTSENTSGTETAETLNAAIAFNREIRGTPYPSKNKKGASSSFHILQCTTRL